MWNYFKRFGKWALIGYIAYNVVELIIVLIFFPEVFTAIGGK